MFCLLQIAVHYQKSLKIHRKILFPKTRFGSRNCPCQHKWFGIYPWPHYDIEKDCLFCFYCMKNISKLTAEKNKEPTYTSIEFKNWKKAPECFKDHQNSKYHKEAAILAVILCWSFNYDESKAGKIKSRRAKIFESCNRVYSISRTPGNAYQRIRSY